VSAAQVSEKGWPGRHQRSASPDVNRRLLAERPPQRICWRRVLRAASACLQLHMAVTATSAANALLPYTWSGCMWVLTHRAHRPFGRRRTAARNCAPRSRAAGVDHAHSGHRPRNRRLLCVPRLGAYVSSCRSVEDVLARRRPRDRSRGYRLGDGAAACEASAITHAFVASHARRRAAASEIVHVSEGCYPSTTTMSGGRRVLAFDPGPSRRMNLIGLNSDRWRLTRLALEAGVGRIGRGERSSILLTTRPSGWRHVLHSRATSASGKDHAGRGARVRRARSGADSSASRHRVPYAHRSDLAADRPSGSTRSGGCVRWGAQRVVRARDRFLHMGPGGRRCWDVLQRDHRARAQCSPLPAARDASARAAFKPRTLAAVVNRVRRSQPCGTRVSETGFDLVAASRARAVVQIEVVGRCAGSRRTLRWR